MQERQITPIEAIFNSLPDIQEAGSETFGIAETFPVDTIHIDGWKPHPRSRSVPPNFYGSAYTQEYVQYLQSVTLGSGVTVADHIMQQRVPYIVQERPETLIKKDGSEVILQKKVLVHEDGNEITRDVAKERKAISEYLALHDQWYQELLLQEAQPKEDEYPMHDDCRIAVVMCANREEKNTYSSLELLATQMDSDQYEIIFVNAGVKDYSRDGTLQEVQRFMHDYPYVHMVVKDVEFGGIADGEGLGLSYKFGFDLALQRSLLRKQTLPFYISSKVADMPALDAHTLALDVDTLDAKPFLDMICAERDYYPQGFSDHDYALLSAWIDQLTYILLEDYRLRPEANADYNYYNGIITAAVNTTISAEAYVCAGGHSTANQGVDYGLRKRVELIRAVLDEQGNPMITSLTVQRTNARSSEDIRRVLYGWAHGINPYITRYTDPEINAAIRKNSWEDFLQQIPGAVLTQDTIEAFENLFTDKWKFIQSFVKDPAKQEEMFTKLMAGVGFKKYRVVSGEGLQKIENGYFNDKEEGWQKDYERDENGAVKIKNIENIKNALEGRKQRLQQPHEYSHYYPTHLLCDFSESFRNDLRESIASDSLQK